VFRHVTGLLVIAEDQPQYGNRVEVDPQQRDAYGMPRAIITHRYSPRDRAARRALARIAASILRQAGARATYRFPIRTFSHAIGTLRMGRQPETSPLDSDGRFRGVDNLWVADGSALPTAAGVNPSLTIDANALRTADRILGARQAGNPSAGHVHTDAFERIAARLHPHVQHRLLQAAGA